MSGVLRIPQVVQREVGRDDQRLAAAVTAVNQNEKLFQPVLGAALHAEVVNDKQRIAAKAGNILIPACKAGREVAQDNGEVRHIYGDFFLHEGVCDTACKVAFAGAYAAPEQAADIVYFQAASMSCHSMFLSIKHMLDVKKWHWLTHQ